jgi:hypothetical protein
LPIVLALFFIVTTSFPYFLSRTFHFKFTPANPELVGL